MTNSSGGIGISTVLFLIFLVLKLIGTISWSWWWVLAPLWLPVVFAIGIVLVLLLILLIVAAIAACSK
jgi:hypothetical protein